MQVNISMRRPALARAFSTLQVFSPQGSLVRQWVVPGREGDQFGADAVSVAVDGAGNVYVAEVNALRVQKFSPEGMVLATWQAPPDAPAVDYLHPTALTIDARDDLWVAYYLPDRIVEYSPSGAELTSWPTPELPGSTLAYVTGLTFDPAGHLWLGAYQHVAELSPDGRVLHSWSARGSTPGSFVSTSGIAADAGGAIYVADNWNDWVQKLAP